MESTNLSHSNEAQPKGFTFLPGTDQGSRQLPGRVFVEESQTTHRALQLDFNSQSTDGVFANAGRLSNEQTSRTQRSWTNQTEPSRQPQLMQPPQQHQPQQLSQYQQSMEQQAENRVLGTMIHTLTQEKQTLQGQLTEQRTQYQRIQGQYNQIVRQYQVMQQERSRASSQLEQIRQQTQQQLSTLRQQLGHAQAAQRAAEQALESLVTQQRAANAAAPRSSTQEGRLDFESLFNFTPRVSQRPIKMLHQLDPELHKIIHTAANTYGRTIDRKTEGKLAYLMIFATRNCRDITFFGYRTDNYRFNIVVDDGTGVIGHPATRRITNMTNIFPRATLAQIEEHYPEFANEYKANARSLLAKYNEIVD